MLVNGGDAVPLTNALTTRNLTGCLQGKNDATPKTTPKRKTLRGNRPLKFRYHLPFPHVSNRVVQRLF